MSLNQRHSPFPPVTTADKDGMLLVDNELSQARLIEAYQRGIFPWPIVDGPLEVVTWWSPDPRAVLPLDQLYISRRLRRRIHSEKFAVTINRDFESVISACAEPRNDEPGTWITPTLTEAYLNLHRAGLAHSVEVWCRERLVGGVYGVSIGGCFAAESMFHRETDASKTALVYLVHRLRQRGFQLLDIQQSSAHMGRLGAVEIPRTAFLHRLRKAITLNVTFAQFDEALPPLRIAAGDAILVVQ